MHRAGKFADVESKLTVARDWGLAQEGGVELLEAMRWSETRQW